MQPELLRGVDQNWYRRRSPQVDTVARFRKPAWHVDNAAPQSMSDQLSTRDAYRAMFRFLEVHYERTGSGELGALLGGLAINEDGQPMDPAAWTDWLAAVNDAISGDDSGT
jgi:hypothetical protein